MHLRWHHTRSRPAAYILSFDLLMMINHLKLHLLNITDIKALKLLHSISHRFKTNESLNRVFSTWLVKSTFRWDGEWCQMPRFLRLSVLMAAYILYIIVIHVSCR